MQERLLLGGLVGCGLLFGLGCTQPDSRASVGSGRQLTAEGSGTVALEEVPSLPDLSGAADAVQEQVRARHATLLEKQQDSRTSADELGNAFGELGLILMAAEHFELATRCYTNALALAPEAMRWPYYLGHLHAIRGEGAKAAEFFSRAHELDPTNLPTLIRLGEAFLDQSRPAMAEQVFTRALALEPRSAAALSGVGRAALVGSDAPRAVEYLERALSIDQQALSLHYPLAMAYRSLGELQQAEVHLQQRGRGAPATSDPLMDTFHGLLESRVAYEVRGLRALEGGRLVEAEEIFRRGLALEPEDPALRHRLATTLLMRGDTSGAVEQLEETLRQAPEFARAHFALGMILALNGRHQQASERFAAAVTYQPDYVEARLGLADALRVTGRAEDSLPHYQRIVTADPRFAEAWLGFALALSDLGRHQEARRRLTEARTILPERPEFNEWLARLP